MDGERTGFKKLFNTFPGMKDDAGDFGSTDVPHQNLNSWTEAPTLSICSSVGLRFRPRAIRQPIEPIQPILNKEVCR